MHSIDLEPVIQEFLDCFVIVPTEELIPLLFNGNDNLDKISFNLKSCSMKIKDQTGFKKLIERYKPDIQEGIVITEECWHREEWACLKQRLQERTRLINDQVAVEKIETEILKLIFLKNIKKQPYNNLGQNLITKSLDQDHIFYLPLFPRIIEALYSYFDAIYQHLNESASLSFSQLIIKCQEIKRDPGSIRNKKMMESSGPAIITGELHQRWMNRSDHTKEQPPMEVPSYMTSSVQSSIQNSEIKLPEQKKYHYLLGGSIVLGTGLTFGIFWMTSVAIGMSISILLMAASASVVVVGMMALVGMALLAVYQHYKRPFSHKKAWEEEETSSTSKLIIEDTKEENKVVYSNQLHKASSYQNKKSFFNYNTLACHDTSLENSTRLNLPTSA